MTGTLTLSDVRWSEWPISWPPLQGFLLRSRTNSAWLKKYVLGDIDSERNLAIYYPERKP